ncbi:MAG: ammonium transporter [Planctomycetales bacterium]|nr:ammonium transporter [Planctomycetales bacterium]MCA9224715.1 ammonium transporter [Planctomycetales bacterium]
MSVALASVAVADEETGGTEAAAASDASDTAPEATSEESAEEPAAEGEEAAAAAPLSFEEEVTYTINTLIMFVCAVLVLFMQAGFAMVEVGLNAAKNTINILFKNVMDLAIGVILFLFVGYALMYPGDAGKGKWFVFPTTAMVERDVDAPNMGTGWSNSADFLFQVAFAATAATIVSGAVAGRMKFPAYLIYSAVLTGLIYPISGMWKWGGGALAEWGFADFAGSVVVHAVGGFAGLAGALVLGPRLGRFVNGKSVPMPGHNITFAALGVFILWVGWYGFNPGSQLTYFGAANAEATSYIALTTTIAAAGGTVVAMALAWILFGKPDVTMALNGALAGLVGITANCDQVSQLNALLIGAVAGALVVAGIILLDKLHIDDPVGAFPVHGICGVWGGIATGIFGTNIPEGLTRGGYIQVQLMSTAIIAVWAFVTMFGLFYVLKLVGVLRVSPEEEQAGLDVSEHGMHAYPPSLVVDSYPGSSVFSPKPTGAAAPVPATEGA